MIKLKRIISMLLVVAMVLLYLAPVATVAAAGETVTTDKATYDIGDTIQVTGTGFTAWTVVALQILKNGTTLVYVGQVSADGSGAFATGILAAWSYGNYTLRAGTTASTTFVLTATGILTTDRLYYKVGATGTLTGTGFPNGPAKSLAIVTPGGDIKYILATQPTGSSFSDTFLVGAGWVPGIYWGRAVYLLESVTRTVTTPFTVVPVPPVPTTLTASAGHNEVALNWTAVTNPAPGVVTYTYKVYRSTTTGTGYTYLGAAATNSYLDTTATATAVAGTYYYVVTSVDNTPLHYESAYSNEASATPWGDTVTVTFPLIVGWNMITVPVTTATTNPIEVFKNLPVGWRLYSWDAAAGIYRDKSQTLLALGAGYWLKVAAPNNYPVTGLPNLAPETAIPLFFGWNMIGNPYAVDTAWTAVHVIKDDGLPVSLNTAVTNGWIQANFYYWNDTAYEALNGLTIGGKFGNLKGYWTKALMTGVELIFPKP